MHGIVIRRSCIGLCFLLYMYGPTCHTRHKGIID